MEWPIGAIEVDDPSVEILKPIENFDSLSINSTMIFQESKKVTSKTPKNIYRGWLLVSQNIWKKSDLCKNLATTLESKIKKLLPSSILRKITNTKCIDNYIRPGGSKNYLFIVDLPNILENDPEKDQYVSMIKKTILVETFTHETCQIYFSFNLYMYVDDKGKRNYEDYFKPSTNKLLWFNSSIQKLVTDKIRRGNSYTKLGYPKYKIGQTIDGTKIKTIDLFIDDISVNPEVPFTIPKKQSLNLKYVYNSGETPLTQYPTIYLPQKPVNKNMEKMTTTVNNFCMNAVNDYEQAYKKLEPQNVSRPRDTRFGGTRKNKRSLYEHRRPRSIRRKKL